MCHSLVAFIKRSINLLALDMFSISSQSHQTNSTKLIHRLADNMRSTTNFLVSTMRSNIERSVTRTCSKWGHSILSELSHCTLLPLVAKKVYELYSKRVMLHLNVHKHINRNAMLARHSGYAPLMVSFIYLYADHIYDYIFRSLIIFL